MRIHLITSTVKGRRFRTDGSSGFYVALRKRNAMKSAWYALLLVLMLVACTDAMDNEIVTRVENVIELRASLPIVCRAKSRGFEVIFPSSAIVWEMAQIFALFQRQSSCALRSLLASNCRVEN